MSDGSALTLTTDDTIVDDTTYFYEVGVSANVDDRIDIAQSDTIQFMDDDETGHFQGFTTTTATSYALTAYSTCDTTASYFRLYKVEDTYAVCDGSQTSVSTLLSNEFWVLDGWGYKFVTTVSAIGAGSVTPIAGVGDGLSISATVVEDTQNVKGLTTYEYAGLEASTLAEDVKVTELIIYRYGDLWGQWAIWGDQ